MATICSSVWEAVDLFALNAGHCGKDPTSLTGILYICCRVLTLLTQATSVWSPYAKGNGQWIARNIVMGFVAAPIESLPETSITDVYFTHERGTYLGWYAWILAGSNYFAPVITGFINDSMGYKWPFYFMAIFAGCCFVFLFLFMEETNYDRISSGATRTSENLVSDSPTPDLADGEKATPAKAPPVISGAPKTFTQKLALLDKPRPFIMHKRAARILKLMSWPGVFYAGFSYGTYLVWFNIFNATASVVLGGAPYNFKPSIVGLSYFACIVGVCLGYVLTF